MLEDARAIKKYVGDIVGIVVRIFILFFMYFWITRGVMVAKKHSKKNIRGHWKYPRNIWFLGAMRGAKKDIEYGMGSKNVTEEC